MARTGSQNVILATVFALLTYLPFRTVAKVSLQICLVLFILDPIPPYSRLASLVAAGVVFVLSKLHNNIEKKLSEAPDPRESSVAEEESE